MLARVGPRTTGRETERVDRDLERPARVLTVRDDCQGATRASGTRSLHARRAVAPLRDREPRMQSVACFRAA
jgi:hypothetical protein